MRIRLRKRIRVLRRQLNQVLSRKISTRLIITYVGLGAVPLVIVSLFLISLTQETVQSYIYERNMETARLASNEIERFIKTPITILRTTGLTRDITEMDRFSQNRLISRIKDENPIFQKIFVLNDSGAVVSTTEFGAGSTSFAGEELFLQSMQGREYFSDVYYTEARFPVMTIGEPVKKFYQTIGVLAAEIDLKSIWAVVDSITIENTGIAFLLSGTGEVIAHKIKSKLLGRENYSSQAFFPDLQAGKEGIANLLIDDQPHILVYVPIPQLQWGIVIQQRQDEAFSLVRQMQQRLIFFVLLTTLVAILLGFLWVQGFTRPLNQLVQGAREYGSGNLKHRINTHTRDELAELAREFNSMASSLQQNQKQLQKMERLAALSRFASLVSHEVRNPLNSMNINMQILKKIINSREVDPRKKEKYLDVIASEIKRINDLVTNFLSIARPPELQLARTSIHDVLEEVVLLQRAHAAAESIEIVTEYTSAPSAGMFDQNQLKQIFHNIIINAMQAMESGGKLTISTRRVSKQTGPAQSADYLKIDFTDTGHGIPHEIMEEIFEFYYSTKRAGSGLGLAIAKQIVEGHQGIVYIVSQENHGTTVTIELPVDARVSKPVQ